MPPNFRSLLASTPWLFWAICYSTTACRCLYGMPALSGLAFMCNLVHARRHAVFSYWIPQGLCSSFIPKSARSGQDAIMSARRIFSWLSETAIQKQHFSLSSEHVHLDPCCRSVVGDFGGCAAATSTRSIVSSLQYEIF